MRNRKTIKIMTAMLFTLALIITIEVCYIQMYQGTTEITEISTFADGIPVVETYLNNGKEKPMIIIQHGFKNRKESTLGLAESLAEKGFFVVSPDAYAHGERMEEPLSLVHIIVKTSRNYDKLIASYEDDTRVDVEKLGIAGFSMGGCITFHYAVYGKYHPKAIAPTIGTPYFEQLIGTKLGRSSFSSHSELTVAESKEEIKEIDDFTMKNSPFKDYKNLQDVAVLMQNGELDTYVASDGVKLLYQRLPKINPNVQLIMIPETKHKVTEKMKLNIVEFMTENLH